MKSTAGERRRTELLEYLKTPQTMEEIAQHFHTSRVTIYRIMNPLVEEGVIIDVPWRDGRQKKWVVAPRGAAGRVISIYTPSGIRPLGEYIGATHNEVWEGRLHDIDGALAQIWRYCAYHSNPDGTEKAKAGSMTPVECKTVLRNAKEFFERLNSVLEQVLLADIYDDASLTTAEKFGEVNLLTAIEIGSAFEKRHGH